MCVYEPKTIEGKFERELLDVIIGPSIRNMIMLDFGHIQEFDSPLLGSEFRCKTVFELIDTDQIAMEHTLDMFVAETAHWQEQVGKHSIFHSILLPKYLA